MTRSQTSLRLAFMGTPDFAVPVLAALAEAGHEIVCVYSQPPRPAGRGHKPRPSPVQALAEARGWQVRTPRSLKDPAEQAPLADFGLDAAVVVAYGLLLPTPILAAPRLGCLNVHASLLPRWRGAAPIQRAILAGDRETGITIMQMDEGLDTGPMLLQERLPIGEATTAADLHDALAALGADLIVRALDGLASSALEAQPQPEDGVTYAAKLERAEGRLDWRLPAEDLARRVRAFTPWPGAFTELPGTKQPERLKVLAAEALIVEGQAPAAPGTLIADGLTVACGRGALRLLKVQRAGKAAMSAGDFLRGRPMAPGTRLPLAEAAS